MALKILLLEPYFTGSHAAWALGCQDFSRHQVEILSLKGQFWKWRMHGGAVTLARRFLAGDYQPDLIVATDMLDLAGFLALTRRRTAGIPAAVYFHENQLAYPWSPDDRDIAQQRDHHYGFINYASALAADAVFFNSRYNKDSFLNALQPFLKHFPDFNELSTIDEIQRKSSVLPLGLDLSRFDHYKQQNDPGPPIVLWNHRWEFDKNPAEFFQALNAVDASGVNFRLALLGENFRNVPAEFQAAKSRYGSRIVHYGYAKSMADYAGWLWRSHVLPVTSRHDFFGISVIEAVYCGCRPLLPKRLAYPEIFADENQAGIFYNDFDDLTRRLREALVQADTPHNASLRQGIEKYHWENMAPIYDAAFEDVVHGKSAAPFTTGGAD